MSAQKYRKKPVVIEAMQWTGSNWHAMLSWAKWEEGVGVSTTTTDDGTVVLLIDTLEGQMMAQPGDWVIQGVQGEMYPCKPDIFDATYEPV